MLIGDPVRYNSKNLFLDRSLMKKWNEQDRLIVIRSEVEGGMSVPRAHTEITKGPLKTLKTTLDNNCVAAILY